MTEIIDGYLLAFAGGIALTGLALYLSHAGESKH